MIKNVVFDWSGTLCDDASYSHRLSNQVLEYFGAEAISLDEYLAQFCIPVDRFYHRYLPKTITIEQIDAVYMRAYADCFGQPVQLFAGVKSLLQQLKSRGFGMAILSTVDSSVLRQGVDYFQLPIGHSNIYGTARDKHQWLPLLLEQCDFNADETLLVGDTPHDIEVGQAANTITAAACYGYTDSPVLQAVAANYYFESVAAMRQQLDKDYVLNQQPLVLTTVGSIIQARDSGKILLVRTRKWRNKWGTPGGKVDYGETLENAVIREVWEETGINIDNPQWILNQEAIMHPQFIYPQHFIMFNYYSTIASEVEPHHNYESQEIGWFNVEQAKTMDLNQPTRLLIDRLCELQLLD